MGQLVQRPAWPWGALNERKDLGAQAGFWGEGWPPLLGHRGKARKEGAFSTLKTEAGRTSAYRGPHLRVKWAQWWPQKICPGPNPREH